MNIWSSVMDGIYPMPGNNTFTGGMFSSDSIAGTFSYSDTGEVRVYSGWDPAKTDPIYRLTYALESPLVLPAGEYFFSHDMTVPEPATMSLLALGGLGALIRRRNRK